MSTKTKQEEQDKQQELQELSDKFRQDIANQGGNNATQLVEQFINDVQALFDEE